MNRSSVTTRRVVDEHVKNVRALWCKVRMLQITRSNVGYVRFVMRRWSILNTMRRDNTRRRWLQVQRSQLKLHVWVSKLPRLRLDVEIRQWHWFIVYVMRNRRRVRIGWHITLLLLLWVRGVRVSIIHILISFKINHTHQQALWIFKDGTKQH